MTQLVTGFVAKVEEMGGEIPAILISTGKMSGMEEMATWIQWSLIKSWARLQIHRINTDTARWGTKSTWRENSSGSQGVWSATITCVYLWLLCSLKSRPGLFWVLTSYILIHMRELLQKCIPRRKSWLNSSSLQLCRTNAILLLKKKGSECLNHLQVTF